MICHTHCTLHIEGSAETNAAILLRGRTPSGEEAEALLIYTRHPDEIDAAFGHDRIFLTYKGEGTHGLVRGINISSTRDVTIQLNENALAQSVPTTALIFKCVANFDNAALGHFAKMCDVTRTEFAFEIPVR
jgi:hypothetical protein